MASDSLFTQEIVREFMLANGGKVTNPVLIAHFKNFLNDPIRKVSNRQQFKTFINTLATVKLDESGTKVLVLKKKFREGCGDVSPINVTTKAASKPPPLLAEPKHEEVSSSSIPSTLDSTKEEPRTSREETSEPLIAHVESSQSIVESQPVVESHAQQLDSTQHSNKNLQQQSNDEFVVVQESAPFMEEMAEVKIQPPTSTKDLTSVALDSPKYVEEKESAPEVERETSVGDAPFISLGLNLATNYFLGTADDDNDEKEGTLEKKLKSEFKHNNKMDSFVDGASKSVSVTSPDVMKVSTTTLTDDDSPNKVLRVRDAALNIDKMENEKASLHVKGQLKTKRESRKPLGSDSCDIEPLNMTDLDRNWLMTSCLSDYQTMCKILQTSPYLASRKDFITGYNALHWACKNGNADVLKLLCGKYSADPNARTSGGYTPLHLATMMNHEDLIDLLVKVYKADSSIRDYSGKLAKHYLGASKKSLHLVMPLKGGNSNYLTSLKPNNANQNPNKENSLPHSPAATKPFRQDNSGLMPPPTKAPPISRKRPTSPSFDAVHSDSETSEAQMTLQGSSSISSSSPNFETVV